MKRLGSDMKGPRVSLHGDENVLEWTVVIVVVI